MQMDDARTRLTDAEMRAAYEAGASTRQIAAIDGRSYARVNALIRRAGGTLRPWGRPSNEWKAGMVTPDPTLMAASRLLMDEAAALYARGLKAEAQAKQAEATAAWMRALGRPDTVQETRR